MIHDALGDAPQYCVCAPQASLFSPLLQLPEPASCQLTTQPVHPPTHPPPDHPTAAGDILQNLTLEVREGGKLVAIGTVPSTLAGSLFHSFDASGTLSVDPSQLLFEIPSSQFAAVNQVGRRGETM